MPSGAVTVSPGSAGEAHPLRHHVKSRHSKVLLPRNPSSARNLAKLARQVQQSQNEEGAGAGAAAAAAAAAGTRPKGARQRSHESDKEIRLPGSLDDSSTARRRASQLPRNSSHTKLKKNLSHGQLGRLQSGKNLHAVAAGAAHHAALLPLSPGLKGKSKRRKSAEAMPAEEEKDGQQQRRDTAFLWRQQNDDKTDRAPKKVGFAVGSAGDSSEDEGTPQMEGSGLQEDEWTDQSASASPYSTRQNTANNSRRTSVVVEKPPDKHPLENTMNAAEQGPAGVEEDEDEDQDDEDEDDDEEGSSESGDESSEDTEEDAVSPRTQRSANEKTDARASQTTQPAEPEVSLSRTQSMQGTKEHTNPTTRRLLDRSQHAPAPALVSNVSALDDARSARGSPAASMRSSRSNIADGSADTEQDELVSRFIPSASHPSVGSGANTTNNTPKQGSFHTPEEDSTLRSHRRNKSSAAGFQIGVISPGGSTVSGSPGPATPALGRSRTELRMLQEKALADMESAAERQPILPAHIYDRRNESLKSYLNLTTAGTDSKSGPSANPGITMKPEIFQGRFRAVNTELRVIQKFRDPMGDAIGRLKASDASKLHQRSLSQKEQPQQSGSAALVMSKSMTSLPARQATSRNLAQSASPPKSGSELKRGTPAAQSSVQIQGSDRQKPPRREVSFARAPAETREVQRSAAETAPEVIARQLWGAI